MWRIYYRKYRLFESVLSRTNGRLIMFKKKLPKNVVFFFDEVYGIEYMIVVTPKHSKFRRIMKEYLNIDIEEDEDDLGGQFQGLHDKKKGDLGVIWCTNKKATLIHEIFHLVSWAMRSRDISLDSEAAEEAWAYYIAYIYREIHERLKQ